MNIGILTPGFSAHPDDWAIPVLQNLVTRLSHSHDVRVFTLRYPYKRGRYRIGKAEVFSLGGADRGGLLRLPILVNAVRAVRRAHREKPFDLLHAFWMDEPAFAALWAARALRVPVLASVMGGELVGFPGLRYGGQLSRINRLLTRYSLREATIVTAGSRIIADLAQRRFGRAGVQLLPLGVDTSLFQPALEGQGVRSGREVRLLSVGSLVPVKDHLNLFGALARLTAHGLPVHLDVVGGGRLEAELKSWVRAHNLVEHVTWQGAIPHPVTPARYRAADLLVISSRFESQSLALLEAGATRLPVTGTAVGALPDILPEPLLAPTGEPEILADRIQQLIKRPEDRLAAGQALFKIVNRDYSLDRTLTHLERLYSENMG